MGKETIKRLASSVLGVGTNKVWLDPAQREKIAEALTRDDIKKLIKEGAIKALPTRGVSRHRARQKQKAKRMGKRRGHGSRKGTKKTRQDEKKTWMQKVRAQRNLLSALVGEGKVARKNAKPVYLKIKGNSFRGKQNLLNYLKENEILEEAKK